MKQARHEIMAAAKPIAGSKFSFRLRIILLCLSIAIYLAIFLTMYVLKGDGLSIAAFFAVVGAGLLFGTVPGIAAGLLAIPLNIALHEMLGLNWDVIRTGGGMAGSIALIAIGGVLGHLRDLQIRLSSELSRRVQVEKQLEEHRDKLEATVRARTGELEEVNRELRHLRNLLKNMIDSMPSVLVGVDLAGRVIQWNREAEEMTGVSAAEARGKLLRDVFPMLAREMGKVHLAVRECRSQVSTRVAHGAEGERRYSDVTVYPLVAEGIKGAVIRVDEVTERLRLEEMIIQSEKMLSVGGLAAGMAHEINNPLAGIMQNVQILRNRFLEDTRKNRQVAESCNVEMEGIRAYVQQRGLGQTMDHISASVARAAEIVENMLSFSRKSEFEFVLHDIEDIVENAIELAAKKYNIHKDQDFRKIEIVREYQKELPKVPCEKTKIQQVLLNLLTNGAEAMSAAPCGTQGPRLVIRLLQEKETVCIQVQDNGPGMTETVRRRVFEPFFSTKGVGEGTGLGLSISYFIIVNHHRGTMDVESSPGKGSNFIMHLPLYRT